VNVARAVDILCLVLLVAAGAAFALGINALGDKRDVASLYWLVVGGLLLRSSTDMLRPRSGGG
jgi:hypothetical protein